MLSRQVVVVRIPPPLQPPPLPGAAMRQGQECTSKRPARHDCISGRLVQAAGWAFVRRNFRTRVKTAQHSSTGGHRHPEHASCHCHLPATDPIASSPLPCFPPRPLLCFVPPSHPPRPSHHHIGWLEWLCCTQRHGRRRGGKPRSGAFLNLPSTPSDISSPRNRTAPNPKSSMSHFSWSRDCAHSLSQDLFFARPVSCRLEIELLNLK